MTNTISSRVLSPQPTRSSDLMSTQHQSDEVKVNKSINTAVAPSKVQVVTDGLQIVHATNGRVRIRATDDSFNTRLENIAQSLRQQKGVREAITNQQTNSLVVTFNEDLLTLPQMLTILQKFNIQYPQTSPQTLSDIDPFAAWKSVDFWKEQTISFIPLMTGLAVTGGLGISGLAAIPVYMITTDATRRVIDYLEPQVFASESSNDSDIVAVTKSPQPQATSDRKLKSASPNPEVEQKVTHPAKVVYKVVHTIPGRIRFHLPRIAQDRAYARRLERLIKTDPQTLDVRVNDNAGSIAIAYRSGNVNLNHWVSLMELALQTNPPTHSLNTTDEKTTDEQPPEETVIQAPEAIDATTTSEENTSLDLSGFWADMKYSGLFFSLAYMANLPL